MKNGIRRRLILLFITASAVECLLMFVIAYAITAGTKSISSSYSSNVQLENFKSLSEKVFDDLDCYMKLKSYENIDRYFRDKSELERLVLDFNRKPAVSPVSLSEYTVCQFTGTFLNFCDSAVYNRRSGNASGALSDFHQAEIGREYLESSISKLNGLYFRENLENFQIIRNVVTKAGISSALIIVAVSVLIEIILYIFVSNITEPLSEISETANRLAERNFDIPLFTYNKRDEIGNICRAFNRMIISIREYIDTIWEKAIKENEMKEKEMEMNELYQEAKLTALQSQINPHFLFNTLNTGAQLAMMEGSDRTCGFLEQVAEFYRYNLQFTGHDSILENEIKLLESYVYIMKVRFGDRFTYSTEILTGRLSIPVPGMVLQPLVENCIKHGFKEMAKGGKIVLKAEETENSVIVTVSDNGAGFPEARRIQLLSVIPEKSAETVVESKESDSGTGVGMKNVIKRLRMFYKSENVFDIKKNDSGGTSFVITIPLKKGEE